MNRRISIIVMNKKTENQVLHEGANQIAPATPATPEELNVAPLPAVSPNVQENTKITAPAPVPVVAPH
jgi:chemotaxis protein MotB